MLKTPLPLENSPMTNKPITPEKAKPLKTPPDISHPGMMGDGTQEQDLDERGNPAARIKKEEVEAAFDKQGPKKSS
jgi:hypothetical protein